MFWDILLITSCGDDAVVGIDEDHQTSSSDGERANPGPGQIEEHRSSTPTVAIAGSKPHEFPEITMGSTT